MKQSKAQIRKKYRKTVEELSADYFIKSGHKICELILQTDLWINAKTVFVYVSLPTEADTNELLVNSIRSGKKLCVPKITGDGKMDAVEIDSLSKLNPGKFGIPEPNGECKTVEAEEIDLIVMPCLAAGEDGNRLGKGGGYYDRFCEGYAGDKIVVCPEKLLCKSGEIPVEAWDVRADAVAHENGIIYI